MTHELGRSERSLVLYCPCSGGEGVEAASISSGTSGQGVRVAWRPRASKAGGITKWSLPAHLSRGISVRNLVPIMHSRMGGLFRTRPDSLPSEVHAHLDTLSEIVTSFAMFISHCWASNGDLKYLTPLVHIMGGTMLLTANVASVSVCLLHMFVYELPTPVVRHEDFFRLPHGQFWELYIGCAMGWFVQVFGYLLRKRAYVFLDCVCISQTDPNLKTQGITNLIGLLVSSNELVLL